MKRIFIGLAIFSSSMHFSCKKVENTTTDLALIQHKWMITSLNGEALRYVGTASDYFNFANNNFLYRFIDNVYDTLSYSLQSNGKTLVVYPVMNGVKSGGPTNYNIKVLDSSQLIIEYTATTFHSIDSLKR